MPTVQVPEVEASDIFTAARRGPVGALRPRIPPTRQLGIPLLPVPGKGRPTYQVMVIAMCVALGGCQRVPSIDVLGAFFPSWMLCAIVGIALTLIVRRVLIAAGADEGLGPRGVVYPALALALGLGTWLALFRG
jgi:YtcA family